MSQPNMVHKQKFEKLCQECDTVAKVLTGVMVTDIKSNSREIKSIKSPLMDIFYLTTVSSFIIYMLYMYINGDRIFYGFLSTIVLLILYYKDLNNRTMAKYQEIISGYIALWKNINDYMHTSDFADHEERYKKFVLMKNNLSVDFKIDWS